MHTLKEVKRDDVCVCAIGAQIGFWVLKNRCVFLCVFWGIVVSSLSTAKVALSLAKSKGLLQVSCNGVVADIGEPRNT